MSKADETKRIGRLLVIGGILWVSLTIMGFTALEKEEFTSVTSAPMSANFPSHSTIQLDPNKPTLILFIHPYCPCSRASLHELDELLASTQRQLFVMVVFTIPSGIPQGWKQGDLWKSAATMPGVSVLQDQDGKEARRFGVKGSGHTLLYNPEGKLLFSGGITPSRGHEGDNPGKSAIINFVLNGHALVSHTPVFGCSLL